MSIKEARSTTARLPRGTPPDSTPLCCVCSDVPSISLLDDTDKPLTNRYWACSRCWSLLPQWATHRQYPQLEKITEQFTEQQLDWMDALSLERERLQKVRGYY